MCNNVIVNCDCEPVNFDREIVNCDCELVNCDREIVNCDYELVNCDCEPFILVNFSDVTLCEQSLRPKGSGVIYL